jgi:hypothetical protein
VVKENSHPNRVERVICSIDFPEDVDDRLRIISYLAKALRADVELVHAVNVCHEYSRLTAPPTLNLSSIFWLADC